MTLYDAAGNVTTKESDAAKREYFIEVEKLIPQESVASIMVAKTTTKSTVVAVTPSNLMLSSTPLSGNFKIKCTSKTGAISYSDEIQWADHALWVGERIFSGCSQVNDKISVNEGGKYRFP